MNGNCRNIKIKFLEGEEAISWQLSSLIIDNYWRPTKKIPWAATSTYGLIRFLIADLIVYI